MADKQIVTKKTVAKPAATPDTQPATASSAKKTAAKKTVEPAASPVPAAAKGADDQGAAKKAAPTTAKAAKPKPQPSPEEKPLSLQGLANVTPEQRLDMIREAAYYKAEMRNFDVGHEADDWNEAEHEIDELLAKARQIYGG
jgi:hypothetical protein